ncbi:MAG TPA: exo-alpha-sialidase, partial [Reyranella sp.]|nr:exo-alpha-sialidase [Reyranella sp.]
PGPLKRVSVDDWKLEACPHHGPSLAVAPDGSQHVAWFTDGRARKGLFYARADSADAPFGEPRALSSPDRQPARPYVLAADRAIHLVWKEFDGAKAVVRWQVSPDGGRSWSPTRTVADTSDASDHPLLVAPAGRAYLSWLTKAQGYRLIPLEDQP